MNHLSSIRNVLFNYSNVFFLKFWRTKKNCKQNPMAIGACEWCEKADLPRHTHAQHTSILETAILRTSRQYALHIWHRLRRSLKSRHWISTIYSLRRLRSPPYQSCISYWVWRGWKEATVGCAENNNNKWSAIDSIGVHVWCNPKLTSKTGSCLYQRNRNLFRGISDLFVHYLPQLTF